MTRAERAEIWFKCPALIMKETHVRLLGRRFGGDGPAAVIAMMGAAKLQDDGGLFHLSYAGLEDGAYISNRKKTRDIVAMCVEIGLLELVESDKQDFCARFVSWNQPSGAADRKARSRASKRSVPAPHSGGGLVTDDGREADRAGIPIGTHTPPGVSRSGHNGVTPASHQGHAEGHGGVTKGSPRERERVETHPLTPSRGNVPPVISGGRKRDAARRSTEADEFAKRVAAEHFPDADHRDAVNAIRGVLGQRRAGDDWTFDEIVHRAQEVLAA